MNAFKHCLVSSNRWTVFSADRRASKATLGSTSDGGFFISISVHVWKNSLSS
jgi:hypothetical protein